MRTKLLQETNLYVSDLEVAESFYTNIVGLVVDERVKDQYSILQYDGSTLILFQVPTTSIENESINETNKLGQISFGISPPDISSWRKRLQKHDVSIEEEITWPNGMQSINFRDPTGNRIVLKTQKRRSQDVENEEQVRKVNPSGLNARWKLYHAVNLGGKRDSTSGD